MHTSSPGATQQRLDDGTPAWAHARATEKLAVLKKREYDDKEVEREAKELEAAAKNPAVSRRVDKLRVELIVLLGNQTVAHPFRPTDTYPSVMRTLGDVTNNYKEFHINMLVTRRAVYMLANGTIGTGAKCFSFYDVTVMNNDRLRAAQRLDDAVTKLEPRGDPNKFNMGSMREHAQVFHELFGMRFGTDYTTLLNDYLEHLFSLAQKQPRVFTYQKVVELYDGALDNFRIETSSLVDGYIQVEKESPDGKELSSNLTSAMLLATPKERLPKSFLREEGYLAVRRQAMADDAVYEATAASVSNGEKGKGTTPGPGGTTGGGRLSGESQRLNVLSASERRHAFEFLHGLLQKEKDKVAPGTDGEKVAPGRKQREHCITSLTNTICAGDRCGLSHDISLNRATLEAANPPWHVRALLLELGGLAGEVVDMKGVPRQIDELRPRVARPSSGVPQLLRAGACHFTPAEIFEEVIKAPHPLGLEQPLLDVVNNRAPVNSLFGETPTAPIRVYPASPPTAREQRNEAVREVVVLRLGPDTPINFTAYATQYVVERLDPDQEPDPSTCYRVVDECLRRVMTQGLPSLRKLARERLHENRAGSPLTALHVSGVPCVKVFARDEGTNVGNVEIFGNNCVHVDHGQHCGSVGDQCLILMFAEGAGLPPTVLRNIMLAQAAEAMQLSESNPDRELSAEGGFVLSAAHDFKRGHSHDCHVPIYFWPAERRNVVFCLLKAATNGGLAVDVLDLRDASSQDATTVHYGLMLDGHARSLQMVDPWCGKEGLDAFLRAAGNHGVHIEAYAYKGWREPIENPSGVMMKRCDRQRCELCGEAEVRPPFIVMPGDVAGRAAVDPLFSAVKPDIMAYMRAAARDDEEQDGETTQEGADSVKVDGRQCDGATVSVQIGDTGALNTATRSEREKSVQAEAFENVMFADIEKKMPTKEQRPWVERLLRLTNVDPGNAREVMEGEGEARTRFLGLFKEAGKEWDGLIDECGGSYMEAATVFRGEHMRSVSPTMNLRRFQEEVAPFVPPELAAYGAKIQEEGVRLHTTPGVAGHGREPGAWPQPPSKEHEVEVMWELFKDFRRGGLIIASNSDKAIQEGRFDDVWASPLLRVAKSNMDGTLSDEGRIVHHQSWPWLLSVNDLTCTSLHPPSRPPTHRSIARTIIYKAASYPGLRIYLAKRDCSAAFKRCFLQIASIRYFASVLKAIAEAVTTVFVVIWLTLTFGWCGSPGEYGVWPAIIDAAHKRTAPPRPELNGGDCFSVDTFVDDSVLAEVDMAERLQYAEKALCAYLEACLGKGAVNEKKLLEEGAWELTKIVWGIRFNLTRVAEEGIAGATMSLPPSKLQKADIFMAKGCWDRGNRAVLQNDVQKLAGNALFWAVVVYPLRLVLPAIWAMTGGGQLTWARASGSVTEQQRKWREFEEATEFTRLIVRQRKSWATVFTSPMAFALSPAELLHLPGGPQSILIGGDASGSEAHKGDVLAAIDHEAGTWHAEHMDVFAGALGRVCGDEAPEGMTAVDFIIFIKELTALACLVVQHGHRWTNKIVCAAWDNMNVVQALATRWSSNRYARYLLAIITRCEIASKFSILGFYIWTRNNHPADDISRLFGPWLATLGYEAAVGKMQAYLDQNPRWAHLKHEPMREILEFLTDEGHAMKSFALPSEATNPNSLAYELAQARLEPNPWADAQAPTSRSRLRLWTNPKEVAVVELRPGLGQLAKEAETRGARVHGLVEADPIARKLLRARFPRAAVAEIGCEMTGWPRPSERHILAFATVTSSETVSSTMAALAVALDAFKLSAVVIACISCGGEGSSVLRLDRALTAAGFHLDPNLSADLLASELGAAQAQEVGLLVYGAQETGGTRYQGARSGAFTPIRQMLRPATEVPEDCRLAGSFTPKAAPGGSPYLPISLGLLKMGGQGAALFPGALVVLRDTGTTRWRVQRAGGDGLLAVTTVGGRESREVGTGLVRQHLVQWARVLSPNGVANPVLVASLAPAGPGASVLLDDRLEAPFFRALLDDECFRLQGHKDDVYNMVLEAVPTEVARRSGLAGRGVAAPITAEAVERAAASLVRQSQFRAAHVKTQSADGDRCGGGPQNHTTANARLGTRGEAALAEAESELFRSQISQGTRVVYERGFRYWWVWRKWRRKDPFLRGGAAAFEDENELIKFYSYFGVVIGYAYATLHTWLHGIQHAHILAGAGDPLDKKLRLRMVRKGLKRRDKRMRGNTRKLAATIDLLLEVIENGGLDFSSWDDTVLVTAMLFGFFKLRRSGEFMRKAEEPDADKCVRVGDCTLAKDGEKVEVPGSEVEGADELIAVQRRSKVDQEGNGVATNTFVASDERLCVVTWFKKLAAMNPAHFSNPTNFLFTMSDGKVLSRDRMSKALKAGARRMGIPEADIDVISLRSGGASAMFEAKFPIVDIQRRGRWASDCWKIYVQEGRGRAKDVADRMAKTRITILGRIAR